MSLRNQHHFLHSRANIFFKILVASLWLINCPPAVLSAHPNQYASNEVEFAILLKILDFVERQTPAPHTADPNNTCIGLVGSHEFVTSVCEFMKEIPTPNISVVAIEENTSKEALSTISVLYFESLDKPDSHLQNQIIQKCSGLSILTVGSGKHFLSKGGIIRFVKKNDRIAFEINLKQSQMEGISFRAQLLRLANNIVK